MLELLNMARTNPAEMSSWLQSNLNQNDVATMTHYGVDPQTIAQIGKMSPVQPLAWSDTLAGTATEQSQYEANNQVQTHDGPGEPDLVGRLSAAGYSNPAEYGENSYAYAQSVDHAMKAFMIDWGVPDAGHRGNIMQPGTPDASTYSEVGIGIVGSAPNSQVGPLVITQDFGRPANFTPQVVGVVYDDANGNHMYDMGEGEGGVQIVVDDANGNQVGSATTWDSGGYQIPVSTPGNYTVTAVDNGQVVKSENIQIGSDNVEVDFDTSQPWQGGSLPQAAPAQTQPPAQAQSQTQAPSQAQSQTQSQSDSQPQSQSQPQSNLTVLMNTTPSTPTIVAGPSLPTTDSSWMSGWQWWRKS
jgi:hypothetical protein